MSFGQQAIVFDQLSLDVLAAEARSNRSWTTGGTPMRVAKLSPDVFADEAVVHAFFRTELPRRNPPGLFHVGSQIAEDRLSVGETLLFTYRGRLRFVGRTATGRLANTFGLQPEYPYCFIVETGSVRPADASLAEIEQALAAVGVSVSLAGQGWTRVPDSPAAERAIEDLVR
jgi:hypothetical protein